MKVDDVVNRGALSFALLLAVAAAALAVRPAEAQAGTYAFSVCRGPSGQAADKSAWHVYRRAGASAIEWRDDCPAGPLQLEIGPSKAHAANHWITARFQAPADTRIAGYTLWRSVRLATDYGWRIHEVSPTGTVPVDRCYAASGCTSLGSQSNPWASSNRVSASGRTDLTGLELALTCALDDASTASCPAKAPGALMRLYGGQVTLTDDYSPVFAAPPTGPLVDPSRTLSGAAPVSLSTTDRGGGVYQVLLEVDGRVVETQTLDGNGGRCAEPFLAAVPCKLSASGTVWLHTTALSDGPHALRILVTDATKANVAAWGPMTIRTANASCNPRPVSHARRLRVRVRAGRGKARRAVTVRHGRAVTASGRLTTRSGAPVAGATLCVVSREDAVGAVLKTGGSVRTDARGRFRATLPAGASRRVWFVDRVADGAVVGSVAVRVRAPVTLRGSSPALHNGQTLRMSGRLSAGPRPRGGVLVELQARRDTGWQTFGTTRADGRGRFRYDYTFSNTTGVQTYELRARVPQQAAYPYAPGASRRLRVTVYG